MMLSRWLMQFSRARFLESASTTYVAYGQPVFDQDDARPDEHMLEFGTCEEEFIVFIFATESWFL